MKKKTPYVPQFADEIAGKTIEKSPLKNHIGTSVVFNQKQPLIQEESKPDFDLYIKWRNKKSITSIDKLIFYSLFFVLILIYLSMWFYTTTNNTATSSLNHLNSVDSTYTYIKITYVFIKLLFYFFLYKSLKYDSFFWFLYVAYISFHVAAISILSSETISPIMPIIPWGIVGSCIFCLSTVGAFFYRYHLTNRRKSKFIKYNQLSIFPNSESQWTCPNCKALQETLQTCKTCGVLPIFVTSKQFQDLEKE